MIQLNQKIQKNTLTFLLNKVEIKQKLCYNHLV